MRFKWFTLLFLFVLFFPFTETSAHDHDDVYIISYDKGTNIEELLNEDVEMIELLTNSPVAIIRTNEATINRLRQLNSILTIEKSEEVEIAAELVNWGIEPMKVPHTWQSGYSGKGVKVAIIDTGIGPHPDLHVKKSVSFIESDQTAIDFNGHGTHIAGIIAALHNDFGVKGIAPGVELYGLKVFNKDGKGYAHDVIRAVDWAIEHEMDIINLSLTTEVAFEAYEAIFNEAYRQGLLIVGAAGNETKTGPQVDNVLYPARFDSVIAVASIDANNKKGYHSSVGPAVEVAAPGVRILSTYANDSYAYLQGTSMATAFVSGYLALLKEAYPNLTNLQLRKKMIDDALDLGPKGKDPFFGYGLVQAKAYELPLYEYPAANNRALSLSFSHQAIEGQQNETVPVEVYAELENGQVIDVTKFVQWQVAHPQIASSRSGRIDLHQVGDTTMTIEYDGLQGQLPVKVTEKVASPPVKPSSFIDLPNNHWAAEAIETIYNKGIITGYEDNTFKPNVAIQRQHVALMISRTVNLEKKIPFQPFLDLKMDAPYYYEIMKTQEANIFTGDKQLFHPHDYLTRAQMAKIIVETFHLPKATAAHPFPDVATNHWANHYIDTLYEYGITTGSNGRYLPNEPVTRTQFVAFIYRAMDYDNRRAASTY